MISKYSGEKLPYKLSFKKCLQNILLVSIFAIIPIGPIHGMFSLYNISGSFRLRYFSGPITTNRGFIFLTKLKKSIVLNSSITLNPLTIRRIPGLE